MPRTMTPAMLAAFTSPGFSPIFFVQMQFNSGTVYLWTGYGSVAWNGQTWQGLGSLISLGIVEDGSTMEARGMSVIVSGFDPVLLPDVLSEVTLGSPVTIYIGVLSGPGAVLADPVILYSGGMDQPVLDIDATRATLSIAVENFLSQMNVAIDRRYSQDDQAMGWPGDLGFSFVTGLQENDTLFWGQSPYSNNNQ